MADSRESRDSLYSGPVKLRKTVPQNSFLRPGGGRYTTFRMHFGPNPFGHGRGRAVWAGYACQERASALLDELRSKNITCETQIYL